MLVRRLSARTSRRAECQVGHEVPVHHVDMQPVGAAFSTRSTWSRSRAKSALSTLGAILTVMALTPVRR